MANINEAFNLTLLIVDKSTQVKIPNITWNVIELLSLYNNEKYNIFIIRI